jgi:hypothetical protein
VCAGITTRRINYISWNTAAIDTRKVRGNLRIVLRPICLQKLEVLLLKLLPDDLRAQYCRLIYLTAKTPRSSKVDKDRIAGASSRSKTLRRHGSHTSACV